MNDFWKNLAALLKVKTIVTMVVIFVFSSMALAGKFQPDTVMGVEITEKQVTTVYDPRVVGIIRHQAPGVLRGQLSDSYRSYRHDGTHPVPAYVLSHCFGNFLGRPDFIAWCPDKRNWAVRLADALGAMPVMWTALPEHNTKQLEAENDAVIFQWYEPVEKYK